MLAVKSGVGVREHKTCPHYLGHFSPGNNSEHRQVGKGACPLQQRWAEAFCQSEDPRGPPGECGPRLCPLPVLCLHRARRDSRAPSFDWGGRFGSQPRKSCQGWRLRVKRKASNVLSRAGPVDIEGPDGARAWGTVEMEAAHGECTGPEGGVGCRNCISCQ